MKILIIQLTRPGDIYCTWPVLSALKRQNPVAEIHLLVRKKFAQAASDFSVVDHMWQFDTEKWINPILNDPLKHGDSLEELLRFSDELKAQNFDEIINLSFSPSSSFLTHLVSNDKTVVRGYTRSPDFYLAIPDEASQYFRAQVGLGKFNRLHVVDIFAMIAGVELIDQDLFLYPFMAYRNSITCHIGASQDHKIWPLNYWAELINLFIRAGKKITIVGSESETQLGDQLCGMLSSLENVENLIGKTSFRELARVMSRTKLFIGTDSGPLHVANCTNTVSLNLSVGVVNFWETGPLTKGSVVLKSVNPTDLKSSEVFLSAMAMLDSTPSSSKAIHCDGLKPIRYNAESEKETPGWQTIEWIYFNGKVPLLSELSLKFAAQLIEASELAIEQIHAFNKNRQNTTALGIMSRADEIFEVVRLNDVALSPLINYFFTQKENIPPQSQDQVIQATLRCYEWLKIKSTKFFENIEIETPLTEKGSPSYDRELLEAK